MSVKTSKPVPAKALICESRVALEFQESENDGGRIPITLKARSADPIPHWYWGKLVHDMEGMELRKETCPIDYCHRGGWDSNELIGVASKFATSTRKGLTITGELVSTRDDDRARDVIDKGRAGIPFEASIDFNGPGLVLEEVGEGAHVRVNGKRFDGPGTVVRKWQLRSVAVCPYGADGNTKSEFQNGDDEVTVAFLTKEPDMATAPKPSESNETPDSDPKQQTDPPDNQDGKTDEPTKELAETPAAPATSPQDVDATIQLALAADRKRQSDIRALCRQAGMADLSDGFALSSEPLYSVEDVRKELFDRMAKKNAAPQDAADDVGGGDDPDKEFKAEYRRDKANLSCSEDEYVASRRVDEGLDNLEVGSTLKDD